MIKTFKHKGLKQFFIKDDKSLLNKQMLPRIIKMLDRLDASEEPKDMNVPGWGLHPLKGNRKGTWSVTVTGNWRITFSFDEENDVVDVDLEDYH